MKEAIKKRFLKYISIDTQSDENSECFPSTTKQFDLARYLYSELIELGLKDVYLDDNCYLYACLPANTNKKLPAIGFIAHLDTSPDMPGKAINPQILNNYDAKDIILNKELDLCLKIGEFPELLRYKGDTLITTDGTTLLGADDKAGIAEIVTAVEYLIKHPEIKHGPIQIGFTPDEEIGRGVDKFDVKRFGAEYAYTIDGGGLGEFEFENFNAAKAVLNIQGRNIHPGYAKNKMINALLIASELNSLLPVNERPEFTDNYEGFYHLIKIEGSVEKANMSYIIRDHNREIFEKRKQFIKQAVDFINTKYNNEIIKLEIIDQYYNMREKVEPVYYVIERALNAFEKAGVKPDVKPIRGGTDGARLSFMGLPCPNIFAGGHNFHGKYEFVSLETMEKACLVIIEIARG